jgi:hypothetical protein
MVVSAVVADSCPVVLAISPSGGLPVARDVSLAVGSARPLANLRQISAVNVVPPQA